MNESSMNHQKSKIKNQQQQQQQTESETNNHKKGPFFRWNKSDTLIEASRTIQCYRIRILLTVKLNYMMK